MSLRIDHEHIPQLGQGRRQALEPLVIAQLGEPDFLVADITDELVDIDRGDLEGFEHLRGVLGDRRQGSVEPVFRLKIVLPVVND